MRHNSKLLLSEYPLLILPSLAVAIGLNEAIVLQQTNYWLQQNGKKRGERIWIYNTYADWQKQFPFFSNKTIRRTIKNLEEKGYLISGSFNKSRTDRTKWYTIDYDLLDQLKCPCGQYDHMDLDKMTRRSGQNDQVIPETSSETASETTTTTTAAELTAFGLTPAGVRDVIRAASNVAEAQYWLAYAQKHRLGPAWIRSIAKSSDKRPPAIGSEAATIQQREAQPKKWQPLGDPDCIYCRGNGFLYDDNNDTVPCDRCSKPVEREQ